ncbi:hypothetical protein [Paenibacillus sp. HB172176]|uniref:hypothetical protein n=1 Tax=Paenibacillus sp. HB172176 TaxID=2493690 RepID=UPI0014393539|nr:hypothetical protein [Paenibacillus sp. HB172176]
MELAYAIEPIEYTAFDTVEEQVEKCQAWGLLSQKATKSKTFSYKKAGEALPCEIVGYVDGVTAVIAFENGQRHCIHPSYLKEMQAAAFGRQSTDPSTSAAVSEVAGSDGIEEKSGDAGQKKEEAESVASAAAGASVETAEKKEAEDAAAMRTEAKSAASADTAAKPKAAKSGKKQKLELPADKVRMTATVKEFTSVPNHFTEEEDEVVIYEAVAIADPALEVGVAWSSHSATLKKLELEIGDTLEFDAKIAAKKLTKHPVPYKINNPSKIQKRD